MVVCAEYLWLDGAEPTQQLRSKMRVLPFAAGTTLAVSDLPDWGYDGSSTNQSPGDNSDLVLKPVTMVKDPLRKSEGYLVMCEVFHPDGKAHATNHRAVLRKLLADGAQAHEPWMGFEQEYTLYHCGRPMGFPEEGFPPPQGPYYCGVGADRIFGRELVEEHTQACLDAGLMLYGINGEVMPGQWEYQIGYRGVETESADPLTVSDHLWMARWLLGRLGEARSITVNLDPKPVAGDWNGAGAHTNFSTKETRDKATGWATIEAFTAALSKRHNEHVAEYGAGLSHRLTGAHETCDINTFKAGERDRGASIRIPEIVIENQCGYIEDRRPGANCDPYRVATQLLTSYMTMNTAATTTSADGVNAPAMA